MKVLLVGEGASELSGALRILVGRIGDAQFEVEQDRVSQARIHAHHGKGKGYFKRAVRWMLEAEKRGFDALILLIDQDGLAIRRRELDEAQEDATATIRRALGVAIKTFDAWMLADERALASVLKYAVPRQPDPETLRDPKQKCEEIIAASEISISPSEVYSGVTRVAQIGTLEQRCPNGFAPFAERVRRLELNP
jgi:hypothetical protein